MSTRLPFRIHAKIIDLVFGRGARLAYSQEGEDLLIDRLLHGCDSGYYVDVGAHHPTRFSNTYRLYCKGWYGLAIDPLPGTRALFAKHRPRDTCVEIGISESSGELTYHRFNDPALNTFSAQIAEQLAAKGAYKLVGRTSVATERLESIFARHVGDKQAIDLMSVDVEGFDIQALRSNDWRRWRPKLILAECLNCPLADIIDRTNLVSDLLHEKGYTPIAKLMNTVFFRHIG